MRFTKMHGIGNDYVYVNCFEETVENPAELARRMSPRRFAVGADGLILIQPSETADVGMRIFNADGSEAEMCGNGIRCLARYAYEHGLRRKEEMDVETPAGVRRVRLRIEDGKVTSVTVNMGAPRLRRAEVPMAGPPDEKVIAEPLTVDGHEFSVTCVSMGNPHCVIIPVEGIEATPWRDLGRAIESHEVFPERTNVHFVEIASPTEATMVTWERGSGATLACGTGASAVCVALNLLGRAERSVLLHLPGGDLEIEWSEDGNVYMTGPAEEVFTGEWPG